MMDAESDGVAGVSPVGGASLQLQMWRNGGVTWNNFEFEGWRLESLKVRRLRV